MNEFLSGPIKCKVCNRGYSQTYITEDGICDWCDRDRLDARDKARELFLSKTCSRPKSLRDSLR